MKTLLVVDDGSSVTFYCRCGRRARQMPYDDYQTGIEFWLPEARMGRHLARGAAPGATHSAQTARSR